MFLAVLLAIQAASVREAQPVLEFPTAGLDDSAAYEGYTARVYRDRRGNAVEIYIDGKSGRVVHLWADDGTLLATASQSTIVREWLPEGDESR